MLKFSFRSVAALLAAALVPLIPAGGADASTSAGDIIDLPPFEIKGAFPWTFARVPGYEVLSLARDRETRMTMEGFLRAMRVAPVFFPPGWDPEHSEPITLFLHHFDGESTLTAMQREQDYSFRPENVSVTQGGVMVSLPGERATQNWLRDRRSPLADQVAWGLALQPLLVPPWYHKGIEGLLSNAFLAGTIVELPGIRWESDELMPLVDVLAVTSRSELAELERGPEKVREQFVAGAMLFVRWAFFAEEGRKRSALFSLIDEASRFPLTEEMFNRIFELTLEEAQSELTTYAHGAARQRTSVEVPSELTVEVSRRAEVTPATHEQVARLLGKFYFLLGAVSFPNQKEQYFAKARTAYFDSFPGGEHDPRLVADLGYLEYFDGDIPAAAPRLEAALSPAVTDSRSLVALARIRLKAATTGMGEDDTLSDQQYEDILAPLRKAMRLHPAPKEAFMIAAALWLNRGAALSDEELAALEHGARDYYHVPQVIIPIIELHKNANRPRVASELIGLFLNLPNLTEDARKTLMDEQAALDAVDGPQ